ncbi:MAG TPA: hypothetical protein VIX90_08760 [Edaphobacter sp.]
MKIQIATAALVFGSVAAQAQMTGVSHPDPAVVTTNDDSAATGDATARRPLSAKPSAGTPAGTAAPTGEAYGSFVPYTGPLLKTPVPSKATEIVDNPDGQIVTSVPEREGELREGTLLRVAIKEGISTSSTMPGTKFTAELVEPVSKNGRVIIPAGAILDGQVTEVRSGRRVMGGAALHLEPRNITLPDGTHYVIHAQLTDPGRNDFHVDYEGTLTQRDHAKKTLAVMSLTTGSGAVAGAMIGGGVGAAVGAGVGAGISTFMWLKSDRQATLDKDSRLVFILTTPMILRPLNDGMAGSVAAGNVGGSGAAQ